MNKTSTSEQQLQQVAVDIQGCSYCNERKTGVLVPGEGSAQAKVVFVGEAPGKEEAKTGRPFIGRAGQVLSGLIHTLGLTREEVFITSAVKYLPSYVTPKLTDIEHGRSHLNAQLSVINPHVVVLLGNYASLALLQEKQSISVAHGRIIERDQRNYFISYHPAAPLYNPKIRAVLEEDFLQLKDFLEAENI